jgi:cytosine/adenosine deaminase-related metal-dependent hydrolase
MRCITAVLATLLAATAARGTDLAPDVAPFVAVRAPVVALRHVTVIDGTGAAARPDQTLVISSGRIALIASAATAAIPAGAEVHDYPGHSVLPGLVGMHDHLYYTSSYALQRASGRLEEPGLFIQEIPYSAPRLYLAGGVTTLRTTGSLEPYTDLKVAQRISAGLMPGPHIDVTAPYLEGAPSPFAQMHELTGPEDARRMVAFWAESGATSFKAYMHITRAELAAAINEAHRRHLKLTGHLCSVSWPEAIAAGIDDFEHGPVYTDSEFVAGRTPDACPARQDLANAWLQENMAGARVSELIRTLIAHHVAVTSTLPVFEQGVSGRAPPQRRMLDVLSPDARDNYLRAHAQLDPNDPSSAALLHKEMQFEEAFAAAGGLLLVGPDPTGNGGVVPGFGDQRAVELLVEAGLTPLAALAAATQNGARFLGREADIGTLSAGKHADLVLVKGDPSQHIADLENVVLVFRDGLGFDATRLTDSVRGQVGLR